MIIRRGLHLTGVTLAALAAAPALASDESARSLAATCANCHGTDGRGSGAEIPPLAGLPAERIVAAFTDYKSGQRPATIMHQIAKGYTDEQIRQISTYLAALKPAR
ncbi:MAG: c-type cytochrome [Rubrivivax sp.]